MRLGVAASVIAVVSFACIAGAQDVKQDQVLALASLASDASEVVMSQYVYGNSRSKQADDLPPWPKGKWSVATHLPHDCPQTTDACVSVLYTLLDSGEVCEWTVLLNGNGSSGSVLEENDEAAKSFLVRLNASEASQLALERKEPPYPLSALAKQEQANVVAVFIVGADGLVERATAVANYGQPKGLVAAAIESIKQWRFKPYLVGTRKLRFQTTTTISFAAPKRGSETVSIHP